MDVLVLGATGSLGRALTSELGRRGHIVRAASRSAQPPQPTQPQQPTQRTGPTDAGLVRPVRVDVATGDGLARALEGADVVVDAANSRSLRRRALDAVLVHGTGRVLRACHDAGDTRYVGISIVGIDTVPHPYYRAKVRQEHVIERALGPWSLLRATQFHELIDQLMQVAAKPPVLALPTAVRLQPVDVADVARRLADAAEQPAAGRLRLVAGPEVRTLGELARTWLRERERSRRVIPIPLPGRLGRSLRDGVLCARDDAVEGDDFASWLSRQRSSRPAQPPM
jgi:uncharacterized protein YbjT (DUF2867 family)